jgi:RNA polymerase sigma-70 factor (ECF subfamily)
MSGNEEAFPFLVHRYLNSVYAFIYRYVESEGDAEDLTQDVFLSVWKNLDRFDEQKKFKAWILTIAKNTSLNWIKKKKPILFSKIERENEEFVFADLIVDSSPLPDTILTEKEFRSTLSSAIATLHPRYRTVLSLRYNKDFTFQEIADALHEPLHTIKSRYRRALLMLKKLIQA